MKHFKQFWLAVLLTLLCIIPSSAQEQFVINNITYVITSHQNLTCEVSLVMEETPELIIPSTVSFQDKDYNVTSIASGAFRYTLTVKKVTIPSGVTSIGSFAFNGCTSIESISLPSSLVSIGSNAFSGCHALASIDLPINIERIGYSVFNDTPIYNNEENWENGVLYVGKYLIKAKETLEGHYNVKEGTRVIAGGSFQYCSALSTITIPCSVVTIDELAFDNCKSLTSISVPNSVVEIGNRAFADCEIMSLELGNSIEKIGDEAFCMCHNLTTINLPNSLMKIGNGAFNNCWNISAIKIPDNVIYIGKDAFVATELYNNETNWEEGVLYIGDCLIQARRETLTSHYKIKEGTRLIANNAFDFCDNTTSIEIPNSVQVLGEYSFRCTGLVSIDLPNSITSISKGAFEQCEGITSLIVPNWITSIQDVAFARCSNLKEINLPNYLSEIGEGAFVQCFNLRKIECRNTTPPLCRNNAFYGVKFSSCKLIVPYGSRNEYSTAEHWKEFSNIEEFISPNLIDGEVYCLDEDKFNLDLTYTRTFNSTNWQPLYIPFNMSHEEWSEYADVAEIRGIYAYDDSEGTEHTVLAFHKLTSGELKPNTPYVIKPKETGEVTFTCSNKTLKAAENGSVWCASTRKKYTLTGVYEAKEDMAGIYAMGDGAFYLGNASSPALSPFRFYLMVEDIDNGYGSGNAANAPRCIQIAVDDEVTTGIDGIMYASDNSDFYYDLSGRKVMQPAKGIYIRNGKKMIIK